MQSTVLYNNNVHIGAAPMSIGEGDRVGGVTDLANYFRLSLTFMLIRIYYDVTLSNAIASARTLHDVNK